MQKTFRLFALLVIIPFLINIPVSAQGETDLPQAKIEAKALDKRAVILQAYLEKYNSPMKYQAQDFIEAADRYNLDWKLLPAIAGVESTFGKFIPGGHEQSFTSYNAWGWGVYGSQAIYFKSWKEGMLAVSKGLRTRYLDQGLTDPYKINRIYSTSGAWGSNVTYFIEDMENFEKNYQQELVAAADIYRINAKIAGTSATLALREN